MFSGLPALSWALELERGAQKNGLHTKIEGIWAITVADRNPASLYVQIDVLY